ncbi:PP2C family protein-serine/threonine phosphatase [Streptantibioticus silvisoli]|uniref:Protein phosphatase 2C domain-containing protein n=1 Tax=Streptantibioticus silvisoli TaxID=2705255 RepID=A0ABT6VY46_9ACTN|nr:protein phosphatase 2C domain-containing protein [Streptantibioticus silvisoli]MDI5963401.1 protein phosphatase 2C domain-containing protein [Streptantibioticus silvisoli]
MTCPLTPPPGMRRAALSDAGLRRDGNQDVAFAGCRLLVVADGFGLDGARAAAAAVGALTPLEDDGVPTADPLGALSGAVDRAGRAVDEVAGSSADPDGVGTTLTALLWTGSRLALAHVGDTRAYLLRDGLLTRLTEDHSMVRELTDAGRLTPEEALAHPQRALLTKALTRNVRNTPDTVDVRALDVRSGDRYLLCSDGLWAAVPEAGISRVLSTTADPREAVRSLVDLANAAGGPDNVSCVVADFGDRTS